VSSRRSTTASYFSYSGFRDFKLYSFVFSRSTFTWTSRSFATYPLQRMVVIVFDLRDFGSLSHSSLGNLRSSFPRSLRSINTYLLSADGQDLLRVFETLVSPLSCMCKALRLMHLASIRRLLVLCAVIQRPLSLLLLSF
jgi:hypothetical protein